MQHIYFMRHGETHYNLSGQLQGKTDIPLNETGIMEAGMAHDFFAEKSITFDRVFSSPLVRAKKTAAIVAGVEEAEVVLDDRIIEMNFGIEEGKKVKDLPKVVLNLFFRPQDYQVPEGGESIDQLKERCRSFLDDMAQIFDREKDTENILVLSHGATLRGLISCVRKSAIEDFWVGNMENCCAVKASYENGCFHQEEYLHPLDGTNLMTPPWMRGEESERPGAESEKKKDEE